MPEWLIWIIGGVIVFELVEHAVLPLIWSVRQRRRGQADPLAALAGRRVKVAAVRARSWWGANAGWPRDRRT
jgi:hypothetical protein